MVSGTRLSLRVLCLQLFLVKCVECLQPPPLEQADDFLRSLTLRQSFEGGASDCQLLEQVLDFLCLVSKAAHSGSFNHHVVQVKSCQSIELQHLLLCLQG